MQKRKPKDFGITYEVRKLIKDVQMEQEIDFEGMDSEILEMEKSDVTNKELKFDFAQPTIWDKFSKEDDSNLKKMKTIKKVRHHKGAYD